MTALLEKAFTKASRLPRAIQEQLASQILEDMDGELKWDQSLADSQNLLEEMAKKARAAKRKSKTTKKGFGNL
jgi:hypothetical protein